MSDEKEFLKNLSGKIMGGVNRFEDLLAWQKARLLTSQIYEVSREVPLSDDFGLKSQIQRAAVSTMSNIAEGFGYGSNKQFLRFLDIARGSICEVQSLLYVVNDVGLIDDKKFNHLFDLTRKTASLIAALQRSLR